MKRTGTVGVRCCGLVVASLFVVFLGWLVLSIISDGLSAQLMTFEQEPAQGWNYWRWFFIKRNLGGILVAPGIVLVLGGVVVWRWIRFARDLASHRDRPNTGRSKLQ